MKVSMKSFSVKFVCGSFLVLIGFVISISNTFAISLEVNPEYLTHKAELVILGRVKNKKIEERTYIAGTTDGSTVKYNPVEIVVTEYEVVLEETFKCEVNESEITILMLGGVLPDGRGWTHSSYFELAVGEQFVAFLVYNDRNEAWEVYAGSMGVYRIEEGSTDTETSIVTSAYGGHVIPRNDLPVHNRDPNVELKLQELLDIIRRELNK